MRARLPYRIAVGAVTRRGPHQGRSRPNRVDPDAPGAHRTRRGIRWPFPDRDFNGIERGYRRRLCGYIHHSAGRRRSPGAGRNRAAVSRRNPHRSRRWRRQNLPPACPPPLILPAIHIRALRRRLIHVLHHLRQVVLHQSHLRVEVTRITMRLALPEVKTSAIIWLRGRLHEVL